MKNYLNALRASCSPTYGVWHHDRHAGLGFTCQTRVHVEGTELEAHLPSVHQRDGRRGNVVVHLESNICDQLEQVL